MIELPKIPEATPKTPSRLQYHIHGPGYPRSGELVTAKKVTGGLGLRKSEQSRAFYLVDHINSGYRVCCIDGAYPKALKAFAQIVALVDWTQPKEAIEKVFDEKLKVKLRNIEGVVP